MSSDYQAHILKYLTPIYCKVLFGKIKFSGEMGSRKNKSDSRNATKPIF